ncbi:DUF4345 family protein [Amycolatopsis sp. 195334CR]|uniref:DUF4345 family protein n=1 Tax=Amycolatopsis sp. 195334CR TaxID=2814588 RepID=UPI001A8E4B1C|nr:DUF4345 family protein [Amycolatopsis sp. 195334CR]MBN6040954.1 DUF4345 family protein [Amycolatopsis sp. 195334CR]
MTTIVPLGVAAFFLAMGAYALAAPAALARPFRLTVDAPESRSEIRAVYGGFGLAIAAVLVLAVADGGEFRRGVVVTVGIALAGMAVGRVLSRLVDKGTSFYPIWFYFVVEAFAAGLLFAAG